MDHILITYQFCRGSAIQIKPFSHIMLVVPPHVAEGGTQIASSVMPRLLGSPTHTRDSPQAPVAEFPAHSAYFGAAGAAGDGAGEGEGDGDGDGEGDGDGLGEGDGDGAGDGRIIDDDGRPLLCGDTKSAGNGCPGDQGVL